MTEIATVAYDYDGILVWGTTLETERSMRQGELVDEVNDLLMNSKKEPNKQAALIRLGLYGITLLADHFRYDFRLPNREMLDAAADFQEQIEREGSTVQRVILSGRPQRLRPKILRQLKVAGYQNLFSPEDLMLKPHGHSSAGWKKDSSDILAKTGPFYMFEDDVLAALAMVLSNQQLKKHIFLKKGVVTDSDLLSENGYSKLPVGIEVFSRPILAHWQILRSLQR